MICDQQAISWAIVAIYISVRLVLIYTLAFSNVLLVLALNLWCIHKVTINAV